MKRLIKRTLTVLAAAVLAAPAAADLSVGGVGGDKGGAIKGIVKFDGGDKGEVPGPILNMGADPYCAKAHKEPVRKELWVFGKNHTLANVFVQVVKGLEGKQFDPPQKPHLIDQVGCVYTPHVSGVMVGQELHIKNSDSTLHNVHGLPRINQEWNIGQPVKGMIDKRKFPRAEDNIYIKCDVHAWMNCRLFVVEHPYYAVTQENGTFEIKGLPPGTYTIKFTHEFRRFQPDRETIEVTVEEGKAADVSVTYKPQ